MIFTTDKIHLIVANINDKMASITTESQKEEMNIEYVDEKLSSIEYDVKILRYVLDKASELNNPVCCICGNKCEDKFGNNPAPVKSEGRCCNKCNTLVVIPERIKGGY